MTNALYFDKISPVAGNEAKNKLSDALKTVMKVFIEHGEVSEWLMELVLKTSDSERDRGFESHLLRLYKQLISSWRSTQVVEGAPLERE